MIIMEKLGTLSSGDIVSSVTNKYLSTLWTKRFGRILVGAALSGAAGAAGDAAIELFEDTSSLAKVWNYAADKSFSLAGINPLEAFIPARHKLTIECIDSFSNATTLLLSFIEHIPGQSLMGKVQGHTVNLYENLGTMSAEEGRGMEKTAELANHMINEQNDRFITHATLMAGTALEDSQIHFTVDGDFKGSMYNSFGVAKALGRDTWAPANIYVPKGAELDVACQDAFAGDCYLGLRICNLIPTPRAAQIEAAKPDPL